MLNRIKKFLWIHDYQLNEQVKITDQLITIKSLSNEQIDAIIDYFEFYKMRVVIWSIKWIQTVSDIKKREGSIDAINDMIKFFVNNKKKMYFDEFDWNTKISV